MKVHFLTAFQSFTTAVIFCPHHSTKTTLDRATRDFQVMNSDGREVLLISLKKWLFWQNSPPFWFYSIVSWFSSSKWLFFLWQNPPYLPFLKHRCSFMALHWASFFPESVYPVFQITVRISPFHFSFKQENCDSRFSLLPYSLHSIPLLPLVFLNSFPSTLPRP